MILTGTDVIEHLSHTADSRVRVTARSIEALYSEAIRAMFEVLRPRGLDTEPGPPVEIRLDAPDPTYLLVDFLNEILWRVHVERARYELVRLVFHSPAGLEAALLPTAAESFERDIKAVTYHEAEVHRDGLGEWETILVFDV